MTLGGQLRDDRVEEVRRRYRTAFGIEEDPCEIPNKYITHKKSQTGKSFPKMSELYKNGKTPKSRHETIEILKTDAFNSSNNETVHHIADTGIVLYIK